MKKITSTELRDDLFSILDRALESGESIEIQRASGTILMVPQPAVSKLSRLKRRETVVGDSDSIDAITWEASWREAI
jgi:hypothetical protein